MTKSKKQKDCGLCDGSGRIPVDTMTCPHCGGDGKIE